MRRNFWIIVILGIILRIFLSLTTFHTDMNAFDMAGKNVAAGNVLNLYDVTSDAVVFNYPPLIYLLHGLFRFLFDNLLGILVLKLPYLIFDLLIGVIFWKIFDSPKKSLTALLLWIFNPVNLYATYMMGQYDVIPAFFIILSVYFIVKKRLNLAALALGFGIAFKLSPVFLLIPLLVFGENFWNRVKLLFLSAVPYFLSIILYLPSQSFRATALFTNQNMKSIYANIPISGGESLLLFPLFLIFFFLLIWNKKEAIIKSKFNIWKLYLIPLLLFFIFTHYHPQWLIWITPLLIFDLVKNQFKNLFPILLIFFSWLGSLFFFDLSLTLGLFSPLWPALLEIDNIWQILNLNPDVNLYRSILQTVFASASLYLIYKNFPRDYEA